MIKYVSGGDSELNRKCVENWHAQPQVGQDTLSGGHSTYIIRHATLKFTVQILTVSLITPSGSRKLLPQTTQPYIFSPSLPLQSQIMRSAGMEFRSRPSQ